MENKRPHDGTGDEEDEEARLERIRERRRQIVMKHQQQQQQQQQSASESVTSPTQQQPTPTQTPAPLAKESEIEVTKQKADATHDGTEDDARQREAEERAEEREREAAELERNTKLLQAAEAEAKVEAEAKRMKLEHQQQQEKEKERAKTTEVDMFSESPVEVDPIPQQRSQAPQLPHEGADTHDDENGYYKIRVGEAFGENLEVLGALGKGVFSSVVLARDVKENRTVAVKVARANETMRKAAAKEASVVRKLMENDPERKRHCITLLDQFDFRGHLCLSFESMSMNLRELLNKYGKNVGLNIAAVKIYAQQLYIALRHIHSCGYIHADIKLDNIVVNEQRTCIRVCDFGTAIDSSAGVVAATGPVPYLGSRFYRAPEAILGAPFDAGVDVWAAVCCVAELFTGRILFAGHTNNEMLRLFQDLRGPIPRRLLRRSDANVLSGHFDEHLNFLRRDVDPLTGKVVVRTVPANVAAATPCKDLESVLCPRSSDVPTDATGRRHLNQLKDLLERCLSLDPAKRPSSAAALALPFCADS